MVFDPSLEATAEPVSLLDCDIPIITGTITQAERSRGSHCVLSRAKCCNHAKRIAQECLGGEQMSISTKRIDDCGYLQQRIAEKGRGDRNSFEDGKLKGLVYWEHNGELFYVLLESSRGPEPTCQLVPAALHRVRSILALISGF